LIEQPIECEKSLAAPQIGVKIVMICTMRGRKWLMVEERPLVGVLEYGGMHTWDTDGDMGVLMSIEMLVKAVLFDLDGTLHDRASGIAAFAADQFLRLGQRIAQLPLYVARFIELDANGKVWKDQVYSKLINEFDLIGRPSAEQLEAEYLTNYPRFAVEFEGTRSALLKLKEKGIKTCILTNGRTDLQKAVIALLEFDSVVNAVVISEEAGCPKPGQEIFDLALRELGVEAGEALMVGDDPISDIAGATNAGIRSIAFRCPTAVDATMSAVTMAEVLNIVDAMLEANDA
jgi:putative hydrolase of the HAD superfamily